jgi:histidinol-phosphate aminotransferase
MDGFLTKPFTVQSLTLGILAILSATGAKGAGQPAGAARGGRFAAGLAALGATVAPSQANFLLADFPGRPAKELADALLRECVAVRPLAAFGFPTALRITVGPRELDERCLAALGKVLGK